MLLEALEGEETTVLATVAGKRLNGLKVGS